MNVLFISYWSLTEGLTQSTVLPHLRLLSSFDEINKIFLVTIERKDNTSPSFSMSKVEHRPLYSGTSYLHKITDFIVFPKLLAKLIRECPIDFIIARGAPAGSLAYLITKKLKLPFVVESFEPHAEYMKESGVWRSWDPRYLFQKYWEAKQRENAYRIFPAAKRYKDELIRLGIDSQKLFVVPCSVDHSVFRRDESKRSLIRNQLKASDVTSVGIYVGKFGGLYFDEEAFVFFEMLRKRLADFRLIILTPDNSELISARLLVSGFKPSEFLVQSVPHNEVPAYLSAADVAFTFYKPSPSKRFLSPIKIGEYWACNLPVVLEEDIGDDAEIIKQYGVGVVTNLGDKKYADAIEKVVDLLWMNKSHSNRSCEVAKKYRSLDSCKNAYRSLIDSLLTN